eukprot:gene23537-biopygen23840
MLGPGRCGGNGGRGGNVRAGGKGGAWKRAALFPPLPLSRACVGGVGRAVRGAHRVPRNDKLRRRPYILHPSPHPPWVFTTLLC